MVDPVVFPEDISAGSQGGPRYSTTVVVSASGREQRIQNWEASRGKWNVAYGVRTLDQLRDLQAFFHARAGMARGFLFKDHRDFSGAEEPIGVGDGTTRAFQLSRVYRSGAISRLRPITRPKADTVTVSVNGAGTSGWTVDDTTGVVTFAVAPPIGASITASFEFYVPARFATDWMSATLDGILGGWDEVPVEEVRE